jgi:hypothetical protein
MRKDIRWLKDCSVDEGGVQLFAYMKEKKCDIDDDEEVE